MAQIVQYLMINGPNVEPVFNGLHAGQGTTCASLEHVQLTNLLRAGDRSTGNMCKADTTSDTIISGAVYLDNSTGNSYRYNKYMQCWRAGGSVGELTQSEHTQPVSLSQAYSPTLTDQAFEAPSAAFKYFPISDQSYSIIGQTLTRH